MKPTMKSGVKTKKFPPQKMRTGGLAKASKKSK